MLSLIARLLRRYDLALSTQTGDRPTALAIIAGRQRVGPLEAGGSASALKRFFLSRSYVTDHRQHRLLDILRLADVLGISLYIAMSSVLLPRQFSRWRLASFTL